MMISVDWEPHLIKKFAKNHLIESGAVPFACVSLNVLDLLADISHHGLRVTVPDISA
jgi:hypothetical protein